MPGGRGGSKRDPAEHARRNGDHAGVGVELAVVGENAHALAPFDRGHGGVQPHRRGERVRQRQRQALVAAGDAGRGLVVDVGDAGELGGGDPFGRVGTRYLHAREDRLTGARRDVEAVEEIARGGTGAGPAAARGRRQRPLDLGNRPRELLMRRPDAAARVAPAVAHALVPEPEVEPIDELADRGVPRQDELGAHLHDRAVRKPLGPHPAPHARARLEHDHLDAAARQLVGGDEPRQAGPDDDRPQGSVPGATATASTAIAPCSCTSTGFSSSSSSPLASNRSPAAAASRAAAATSSAGWRAAAREERRGAQRAKRCLDALGRGG